MLIECLLNAFYTFYYIWNQCVVFGSPHAIQTYCRDDTDPIALCGVYDFVADYSAF